MSADVHYLIAGKTLAEQLAPNLVAVSVRVDNPTAQWLHLTDTPEFVPPGAMGVIRDLPEFDMAKAEWLAPPGVTQPAAIAQQQATLTFYDESQGLSSGIPTIIAQNAIDAFNVYLSELSSGVALEVWKSTAFLPVLGVSEQFSNPAPWQAANKQSVGLQLINGPNQQVIAGVPNQTIRVFFIAGGHDTVAGGLATTFLAGNAGAIIAVFSAASLTPFSTPLFGTPLPVGVGLFCSVPAGTAFKGTIAYSQS